LPGEASISIPKVLRDYFDLKVASLCAEIGLLEGKWGCPFAAFRDKTQREYSYEVEREF